MANVVFIAIDIFLFTAITFFGSKIMFSEETKACRDNGTDILMMWILGFCCLLYGWVYCLLLACGLTTLPLILIFWCVYRMQMNEIAREDTNQERNSNRIVQSLRKEAFNQQTHRADTCTICLEKFKDQEIISELPCDSRHIFHFDCLAMWLRNKQICPLCK